MERKTLAMAVALAGVAGLGVGMAILFAGGPPPAPPRPHIAPAPAPTAAAMKYSATMYRGLIEQDAKTFGVTAPSATAWSAPFPYANELKAPRPLRPGAKLQTPHLRVSLITRREEGAVEGQSFRADQLVLRIENLGGQYLAYRVVTRVPDPGRCEAKGALPGNAIALRPRETVERTECLFQTATAVTVISVEVIEIPSLSYFYVSRLTPGSILYEPRVSDGHVIPMGTVCPQTFSWREIRDGAARGDLGWRDIIDFYARHNCEEYTFFAAYRSRTDGSAPLPARPPGGETANHL